MLHLLNLWLDYLSDWWWLSARKIQCFILKPETLFLADKKLSQFFKVSDVSYNAQIRFILTLQFMLVFKIILLIMTTIYLLFTNVRLVIVYKFDIYFLRHFMKYFFYSGKDNIQILTNICWNTYEYHNNNNK